MANFGILASAMPGILGAAQTRKQLEDQTYQRDLDEQERKRRETDRFLAQRQAAMNLAIQTGDEGAFKEAVKGTPYEGMNGTSYFSKKRANEERETQEALLQDESKIASLIQSGVITPQEGFLRYKALGGKPATRTVKETKQVDVTKQIPVAGPSLPGQGQPTITKTVKAPLTSSRTEEINQFLNVRKAGKSIANKVDLGDRVQILYSDGTSSVEKKGAAPESFKPIAPQYVEDYDPTSGKVTMRIKAPGLQVTPVPGSKGAAQRFTFEKAQPLAVQYAEKKAGKLNGYATPQQQEAWRKEYMAAFNEGLSQLGWSVGKDGRPLELDASAGTGGQPKLTMADMPQGLSKAEQFQWMLQNLE